MGPGQVAAWGKATANQVEAHGFQWNWAGKSSKHIPFDWIGPAWHTRVAGRGWSAAWCRATLTVARSGAGNTTVCSNRPSGSRVLSHSPGGSFEIRVVENAIREPCSDLSQTNCF